MEKNAFCDPLKQLLVVAFQFKKAAPLEPQSFDFSTGLGGVVTKTSSSQMGQVIRIFLGGLVTRILSVPALRAVPSPLPLSPTGGITQRSGVYKFYQFYGPLPTLILN